MPALPINWGLIKEPYNWITVALMVAFSAIAITIIANGGRLPGSSGAIGAGDVVEL